MRVSQSCSHSNLRAKRVLPSASAGKGFPRSSTFKVLSRFLKLLTKQTASAQLSPPKLIITCLCTALKEHFWCQGTLMSLGLTKRKFSRWSKHKKLAPASVQTMPRLGTVSRWSREYMRPSKSNPLGLSYAVISQKKSVAHAEIFPRTGAIPAFPIWW